MPPSDHKRSFLGCDSSSVVVVPALKDGLGGLEEDGDSS